MSLVVFGTHTTGEESISGIKYHSLVISLSIMRDLLIVLGLIVTSTIISLILRYLAEDEVERQWHENQLKARLGIGNQREN